MQIAMASEAMHEEMRKELTSRWTGLPTADRFLTGSLGARDILKVYVDICQLKNTHGGHSRLKDKGLC